MRIGWTSATLVHEIPNENQCKPPMLSEARGIETHDLIGEEVPPLPIHKQKPGPIRLRYNTAVLNAR